MIVVHHLNQSRSQRILWLLEELGLPYEVKAVNLSANEQKTPDYLKINPNGRIPTIIDHDNGDFAVFESGAILIYLADKSGAFLPKEGPGRYRTIQWLMFQTGGVGPMFGQVGFFNKFAGKEYEDKRPRDRYVAESKRLLGVIDRQLAEQTWIAGKDYSIADIATFPWIKNLIGFYGAGELVGISHFTHVQRVLKTFLARPAVIRGLEIPKR